MKNWKLRKYHLTSRSIARVLQRELRWLMMVVGYQLRVRTAWISNQLSRKATSLKSQRREYVRILLNYSMMMIKIYNPYHKEATKRELKIWVKHNILGLVNSSQENHCSNQKIFTPPVQIKKLSRSLIKKDTESGFQETLEAREQALTKIARTMGKDYSIE